MSKRLDRLHRTRATARPQRRSPWRERLVQAERGMVGGLRSDSTFCVHFFTSSILVAIGLVLGLGALEWGIVVLALGGVLAAEMFKQALWTLVQSLPEIAADAAGRIESAATAAVLVATAGTLLCTGLILGMRLMKMLQG